MPRSSAATPGRSASSLIRATVFPWCSRSSKASQPLQAQSGRGRRQVPTRSTPRGHTELSGTTYIECIRSRNPETLCPAEIGYAAITTVNLGVQSYREGKAFFFDKENGQVFEADSSWAARWEERSKLRGKPNQVIGWKAGDTGSLLEPKSYQKLEGDWVNGKDPAESV